MNHILVPVDGSDPSYRAVEHAARIAHALGAKLTVLPVQQYIVGRKTVVEVWTEDEVEEIVTKAKAIADGIGNKAVTIAKSRARDVAHSIIDYAEQNHVDLIVMGASGHGAIKSVLIGSISSEVLRKSICPVTIVH